MESIIEKLLEIAIILLAAKIGAELMRRISQPAVIGELIAGLIIGSYALGLLPHAQSGDVISTLAELGIILLLFEVGLETNLKEFIELGKTSLLDKFKLGGISLFETLISPNFFSYFRITLSQIKL